MAVLVVFNDGLAPVAARGDVINRTWKLDSEGACHGAIFARGLDDRQEARPVGPAVEALFYSGGVADPDEAADAVVYHGAGVADEGVMNGRLAGTAQIACHNTLNPSNGAAFEK